MDGSVIIAVAAPDFAVLPDQLAMLASQQTAVDFEILVCDNSGSLNRESLPTDVVYVDASDTPGAAHARNRGARAAMAPVLLFCDADDLVAPDWVDCMVRGLSSHSVVAGSFRQECAGSEVWLSALNGSWPSSGFSTQIRKHEGVGFATSANMGIRAATFWSAGGFPTEYLRSQDVALSLRCIEQDEIPHFLPGAQVLKSVPDMAGKQSMRIAYRAGKSRVRLARTFGLPPRVRTVFARSLLRVMRLVLETLRHPSSAVVLPSESADSRSGGRMRRCGVRTRRREAAHLSHMTNASTGDQVSERLQFFVQELLGCRRCGR